jgi:hypothetical protein
MDFKKELGALGYKKGYAIDVEMLIDEILPQIFSNHQKELKTTIQTEIWSFCEREFRADFEDDYVLGRGSNNGMSDRTELFVDHLIKIINQTKK